jgi:hypothetical protein
MRKVGKCKIIGGLMPKLRTAKTFRKLIFVPLEIVILQTVFEGLKEP